MATATSRPLRTGVGLLLAVCTVHNALAAGVTSKLQIQIPPSLSKPDGYDHREAMFGLPPYGRSIEQKVYYADSTMCLQDADYTRGGYPERSIDANGEVPPMQPPFILMVDRGGCTFVKKVRNAQRTGATAVLIADSSCLCAAGDSCVTDDPDDKCEAKEPIMADDGSGSDITIPSFLIFKQDADPIKKALKDNQIVRARMSWPLPQPDDRVEYDLWTTPVDDSVLPLLRDFRPVAEALSEHAKFTPHVYVYDGKAAGCVDFEGENQCANLCTNNGRYCLSDPDDDLEHGLSGSDVVAESLRRACIWQEYGSDGVGSEWWTYIEEFLFRCNDQYFTSESCIVDAMEHAGVSKARIDQCMKNSGGLEDDVENDIFEAELIARDAAGVVVLPSLYVNNAPLRGAMVVSEVFEAICAGYARNSGPHACQACSGCSDVNECIKTHHCPGESTSFDGVTTPVFIASLVGLTLCFGCVGLVQWQRSQRQMRAQVRGIMAEYMPVDENTKTETVGFDEDDDDDDNRNGLS